MYSTPRVFRGMWDAEKTCGMRYNLRNGKMRKSHLTAQLTDFRQRQLQPFTFTTHPVQYQSRLVYLFKYLIVRKISGVQRSFF